jgi:hypothetical protein
MDFSFSKRENLMKLISTFLLIKILLLAAVLFFSLITHSYADSKKIIPNSSAFLALLEEAKKAMNFQGELSTPKIFSLNERDLQKLYCSGFSKCNTITAMYEDGILYIDEDFDTNHPVWRSIIFHEMVHHIQFIKYGGTKNCDVWFKKEKEAYKLQAAYLRKQGEKDKVVTDSEKNIICN